MPNVSIEQALTQIRAKQLPPTRVKPSIEETLAQIRAGKPVQPKPSIQEALTQIRTGVIQPSPAEYEMGIPAKQVIAPKTGGLTVPRIPAETELEFQGVTNHLKNLYSIYKIAKKPAEMVREGGQVFGNAVSKMADINDIIYKNTPVGAIQRQLNTTLAGNMLRQLPAEATETLFDYASMYIEPETIMLSGIFKAGLKIPAVRNILTKRIDLLEKTIVGNVPKEEMSNVVGRPMAEGEFEQIIKDLPLWKKQNLFRVMVEKGDPIVAVRTERPFVQKIRDIIGIKQIFPEVAAARPPEVVGVRVPEPIRPPLGLPEGQIMRAPAPITPVPAVPAPAVAPVISKPPITPTMPVPQAETPIPAPISPKTGIIPTVNNIFQLRTGTEFDKLFGEGGNRVYEGGGDYKTLKEYYAKQKGLVGEIKEMTPDEYLSKIPYQPTSENSIKNLKEIIKSGEKIRMPWLDYSGRGRVSQEGRHRALLAKEMGIEKIPVLVVNKYSHKPAITPTEYAYHKTSLKALNKIKKIGMDAGDFTNKPIDFPGEVTIRVNLGYIPKPQIGEYLKGVKWYLPDYSVSNIPPEVIEIKKGNKWIPIIPAEGVNPPVSAIKEPWQMTRQEWISKPRQVPYRDKTKGTYTVTYKNDASAFDRKIEYQHIKSIKQALSEGKSVPANVLADYPELAKQAIKQPPVEAVKPIPAELEPLAQKAGNIKLYHGTESSVIGKIDKEGLRYGDFLTSSEKEALDYAKMRAKGKGTKPIVREFIFKKNEVEFNPSTNEWQYKGGLKAFSGGKYPTEIYKALNDSFGTNMTRVEIDKLPFNELRGNASMALSGGRDEFDILINKWNKAHAQPIAKAESITSAITPAPMTPTPPEQSIKPSISSQITDIMRTSKSMMEAHNRIKTELNMDLSIADLKEYEPFFKGGLPPDMSDNIIKDLTGKINTRISGATMDYGVDEIFNISTPEIMDSITTFEKVKQWMSDRIKNAKETLHNVEMAQNYLMAYPDSLPIAEGVIDNSMKMTRLLTDLRTLEIAIDKAPNKQAIADILVEADRSERVGADKVENIISMANKLIEQGKLTQKDKDAIIAFGQIRKVIKNQIIDEILNSRLGVRIKSKGIKYQVKYTIKSGAESTRNWVSEYVYENLKKKYPDLQILGQKEQVVIKHRDPNTGKYVERTELVDDYDEAVKMGGEEQKNLIREVLPYFNWIPHNRIEGKVWVEVYEPLASGGEQKVFSARVTNDITARKMSEAIKSKMPSAKISIKPHNEKMKYMPSFGSMIEVQLFLNQTGVEPTSEAGQRIINAYRSMSGLMSSLIHAQNIAGYRVDYNGITEAMILKAKQAIYRSYRQDIKELYPDPEVIKDDFRFNVAKKYIDALSSVTEKSPLLDGIKGLSYFWILANKPTYILQNFTEIAWGLARLPKLNKPFAFWFPLSKEYTPLIDLAYKNGVLKPFFGEQMVGQGTINQLNVLGNASETWSSKKIFSIGLRVARDKGLTGQEAYRQAYQYMFIGKPFYNNANTLIGLLGKEAGWVNRYGFIFLRWTLDWANKFARGNTKTKLLTILATILMVGLGGLPFGRKLLSKFGIVNIKKNPRSLSITDRFLLASIPGTLGVDPTFLNPVFYGYKGLGEIGGNIIRGIQITSSQIQRANIDYKKYGIIGAIGHAPLVGLQYPILGMKKAAEGVVEVRGKRKKVIYRPITTREKTITGTGLTTFELGQLYQQKREK